jgi:hypothetical protein
MLSARIPKKTPTLNILRPVLPLIAEKSTTVEDDKTRFITIELRARVNAPTGSATYRKYIRKFEEGTAQEWHSSRALLNMQLFSYFGRKV